MKICKEQTPEVTKLTETHEVSCWLQNPMSPKVHSSFLSGGEK